MAEFEMGDTGTLENEITFENQGGGLSRSTSGFISIVPPGAILENGEEEMEGIVGWEKEPKKRGNEEDENFEDSLDSLEGAQQIGSMVEVVTEGEHNGGSVEEGSAGDGELNQPYQDEAGIAPNQNESQQPISINFSFISCPECGNKDGSRAVLEICGHAKCRPCYIANGLDCVQCVNQSANFALFVLNNKETPACGKPDEKKEKDELRIGKTEKNADEAKDVGNVVAENAVGSIFYTGAENPAATFPQEEEPDTSETIILELEYPPGVRKFLTTTVKELNDLVFCTIKNGNVAHTNYSGSINADAAATAEQQINIKEGSQEEESKLEMGAVAEIQGAEENQGLAEMHSIDEIRTVTELQPVPEVQTAEENQTVHEMQTITEFQTVTEMKTVEENQFVDEMEPVDEMRTVTELQPVIEMKTSDEMEHVDEMRTITELQPVTEMKTVEENQIVDEMKPVDEMRTVTELQPVTETQTSDEMEPVAEIKPSDEMEPVAEIKPPDEMESMDEMQFVDDINGITDQDSGTDIPSAEESAIDDENDNELVTPSPSPPVAKKSRKTRSKKKENRQKIFLLDHIVENKSRTGNEPTYTCLKCKETFSKSYRKQFHAYCNPVNGSSPFKCTFCKRRFVNRSHVNYHERTVHIFAKSYQCPGYTCKSKFSQKAMLRRHFEKIHVRAMATRSGESRRTRSSGSASVDDYTYACVNCNKLFQDYKVGKKHVNSDSDWCPTKKGKRRFRCNLCRKSSFTTRRALTAHKKKHVVKQQLERQFKCNGCEWAFTTPKDLKRHRLTHSCVYRFTCPICGAKQKRKDNFERHLRKTHKLPNERTKIISKGILCSNNDTTPEATG